MDVTQNKVAAGLLLLVMLPVGLAMSYAWWKSSQINIVGLQWEKTALHYEHATRGRPQFCVALPERLPACTAMDMVRTHCPVLTQAWISKTQTIPALDVGFDGKRIVALKRDGELLCDLDGMVAARRETSLWVLIATMLMAAGVVAFIWLPTGAEKINQLD